MKLTKHIAAMTGILAATTLALVLASSRPSIARDTEPTAAPSTQPANKFCAVEKDDPIDPSVTTEYKGKTIAFCCKDCKPKFEKDPEKYMKDLK